MGTIIHIFCMKVNSVSNNGSVNIGEALHNSHTASTKSQGSNTSNGDLSPTEAVMRNIFVDPDVNDQSGLGNIDVIAPQGPL